MFIYFCFLGTNGTAYGQGFHKADKAASFVIDAIESYIGGYKHSPSVPKKKRAAVMGIGGGNNAHFLEQPGPPQPQPAIQFPPDAPQFELIPQNYAVLNELFYENTSKPEEPIELTILMEHLKVAKREKTIENAVKAIEYYEDYARYVLKTESAIHCLKEIKVIDE